jgi:hypothetical protein
MLTLALSPSISLESSGRHFEFGESGGRGVLANNVATTGADLIVEDISMLG